MRMPRATYRLQFNPSFDFRLAQIIVPYLAGLGVSDVYASPVFASVSGSTHGYDVIDPTEINPELGGEEAFDELHAALVKHDMGWIQDIVPNHMAFHSRNTILMDVFEKGGNSRYYDFFDIDWDHFQESLKGRVLAPFLGKFYSESLEQGEIQLIYEQSGLLIRYYESKLPLAIRSYPQILARNLNLLEDKPGRDHPDFMKYMAAIHQLDILSSSTGTKEQYELIRLAKDMLWEIYSNNPDIRRFVDSNVQSYNGTPGNAESFSGLDKLLLDQPYRLSFWKVATEEINYRRFFNINGLISLKVENEGVFDHTHRLVLRMIREEKFTGLRVDHVDGLYDPTGYLALLREKIGRAYLVVEKILARNESLPSSWPVQGSTGYEYLNRLNGIFCRRDNEREFTRTYNRFVDFDFPYEDLVGEKKRLIIWKHMAGDLGNLSRAIKRLADRDRYGRDITLYGLRRALVEIIAYFPVYRTYFDFRSVSQADVTYIREAIDKARTKNPEYSYEFEFIERCLNPGAIDYFSSIETGDVTRFTMKFQQYTGPVMAKGFEDTALYVYNRLISLNEVGGWPDHFGADVDEFHEFAGRRAASHPGALNTTATHDTKRGEDARARINVLSELAVDWKNHLMLWGKINQAKKKKIGAERVPDKNDEYFIYQTLLGTFPFSQNDRESYLERIREYLIKAIREAKVHTAWIKPDYEYEEKTISFIESIVDFGGEGDFMRSFLSFQRKLAYFGIFNSLSQTLLKITSPGVPDFYQGTELWDLSMVDPDNRRPVDFSVRAACLNRIMVEEKRDMHSLIRRLWDSREDGEVKLFLIYRALKARNLNHALFQSGGYLPLYAEGRYRDCVIAYARMFEGDWAITIAPRFLTSLVNEDEMPLGSKWEDTRIVLQGSHPSTWKDAVTGQIIRAEEEIMVGGTLNRFPAALLLGTVSV